MGTYIEPFDFRKILIDTFLGNQILFFAFFVIVISMACGYYRMSDKIYGIILVISSLLFAGYVGEAIVFVILVLLGFIVFKIMARLSNQ